jgi:hypothetical protein
MAMGFQATLLIKTPEELHRRAVIANITSPRRWDIAALSFREKTFREKKKAPRILSRKKTRNRGEKKIIRAR